MTPVITCQAMKRVKKLEKRERGERFLISGQSLVITTPPNMIHFSG